LDLSENTDTANIKTPPSEDIPPNSHKMGRRRIYANEEEKKHANRAKSKKYYEKSAFRYSEKHCLKFHCSDTQMEFELKGKCSTSLTKE
jgi:hypothetical protein